MKQLFLLVFAFLLPASLGLTQDIPRDGKSSLESAVVSLRLEEPHDLGSTLHLVPDYLPDKPRVIFQARIG